MKPAEIIALKDQKIGRLQAEIQQLKQQAATLELLKAENDWLKKQLFGQKRERFIAEQPNQLQLELGETVSAAVEVPTEEISYQRKKPAKKAKPTGRKPWPAHLPRVIVELLPQQDISGLVKIGEDITEELEYQSPKLFVRQIVRPRFVAKKSENENKQDDPVILQVPMPVRPLQKASVGSRMLASIICHKFLDHLPLYRQIQQFARLDLPIARSTMSAWVAAVAQLIAPLMEAHKKEVLATSYLQADETRIQVLDPLKAKGHNSKKPPPSSSHRGYYWVYYDPIDRQVLFEYQPGRGKKYPKKTLGSFNGILQTDGYAAYEAFDHHPTITLAGCMAHVRRKFVETADSAPKQAEQALALIQKLYQIEATAREEQLTHQQRLARRAELAKPIWEEWESWVREQILQPFLPKSPIGKALTYAQNRMPIMRRYLNHGQIEIDNNLVENSIRPIALGRKNYLFAGSHQAARNAAAFYSLLAS
jgi:transposase